MVSLMVTHCLYVLYNKNIKKRLRPANNSQVNFKKILILKKSIANRPFENTNDYKKWN